MWNQIIAAGAICASVCGSAWAGAKPDAAWTYKTVGDTELKMDVFLPEGYEEGTEFPTFVVYHGGSWRAGDTSMHFPDCAYWSRRGMIAVSVDYRLKDRDTVQVPLACVQDAKSAIRYLRKNAAELKVDSSRIVVAGGSAGGQMAAACAMVPEANDDCYDVAISCVPNAVILYNPYFKCEAELSPPNFVTSGLPPFISFLGSEDPAITVASIQAFTDELIAKGSDSEFYVGQGGKHGFCNGRNRFNPFFYYGPASRRRVAGQ